MTAEIVHLYDRRYWPAIQQAWQQGFTAPCPRDLDRHETTGGKYSPGGTGSLEWRASARRLATRLGCHVKTSVVGGRTRAVANDGYPLGIVSPDDRRRYDQHRAEADG